MITAIPETHYTRKRWGRWFPCSTVDLTQSNSPGLTIQEDWLGIQEDWLTGRIVLHGPRMPLFCLQPVFMDNGWVDYAKNETLAWTPRVTVMPVATRTRNMKPKRGSETLSCRCACDTRSATRTSAASNDDFYYR